MMENVTSAFALHALAVRQPASATACARVQTSPACSASRPAPIAGAIACAPSVARSFLACKIARSFFGSKIGMSTAAFDACDQLIGIVASAQKKKTKKKTPPAKPVVTTKLDPKADRGKLVSKKELEDGRIELEVTGLGKVSKYLMEVLMVEAASRASAPPGFRRTNLPPAALEAYTKFVMEKLISTTVGDIIDEEGIACEEDFGLPEADELLKRFEVGKDFTFKAIITPEAMESAADAPADKA